MDKPSAAAMRVAVLIAVEAGKRASAVGDTYATIIDAAVAPLVKAARLAELNLDRRGNDPSVWLSADDHEAWSALSAALAEWSKSHG